MDAQTIQKMQEKMVKQEEVVSEIHEMFPDVEFPTVESQLLARYQRGTEITDSTIMSGRSLLVGNYGGSEWEYGIVSDQYNTVLHEEAIHTALDSIKKMDALGEPEIKINIFGDGARMKFFMDFPEYEAVPVAVNDPVGLRISGTNSYDLSMEYKLLTEALVLKCLNGMVGGEVLESYNSRHKGNLNLETSGIAIANATNAFAKQTDIWKAWAHTAIKGSEFLPIFEKLPFGERHSKEILELPIIQKEASLQQLAKADEVTLWDMSLATTQFLTHAVPSEMVRMDKGMKVAKYLQKVSYNLAG